uniref:DUF4758 domain-containing protein n=1 Tax=Phlebotomus papatasi TaxID=29031 RepID=A0A1B0DGL9_PHLPP
MLEDLADIVRGMEDNPSDSQQGKAIGIGVGRPTVAYTPTPVLEDVARAIGASTDGIKTLYTTYTYFTTIFVDGETDISSRTEVYTNYVTPTTTIAPTTTTTSDGYSTMTRTAGNITMMVTDVRSSSSNGDSEVINNQLDDQISSESNTDEILPSATLLLQTSFTTFTYFTTMYMGTTSSVVSRLETVTNVVTETVDSIVPDATLPITYFTTFTYWTTLFRDGTTTTTSREETVSNVVSEKMDETTMVDAEKMSTDVVATTPTTFFTTYTYFTTSYVGDDTVLSSRFETVTNVVPPPVATPRAININTVNANAIVDETKDVVSRNHGRIVDADGITTILFTTEAVGTLIDSLYAQVIESTSTVVVDDAKATAASSTTTLPTGLVRLIDGTIVTNRTTTLYQSRVIGTVIDGRYAQIIESTSSYLIDRTVSPVASTQPTIEPTPEISTESATTEPPEETTTESTRGGLFGTRKRTFTPVIRPFSSRARPTFNPKRKGATTSALTVTRTDLTPTIRATPALKVESKGRFTSRRQSAPVTPSSSRRFTRPAPSSTRRVAVAPQSTISEDTTTSTRLPTLRSRRPSLPTRRTTVPSTVVTTTPRARTPLRVSFGNRTRIGSLFPPRALLRQQQLQQEQEDQEKDEDVDDGNGGARRKRQVQHQRRRRQIGEYGSRARYIGRRTTTTTPAPAYTPYQPAYRRRTTTPQNTRTRSPYRTSPQRQRATSRRPPTRTRGRTEPPEYALPPPDGTLTVTHFVPVSTSVAKVENGATQYRHVVTQSRSVETVTPGAYTVSQGVDGQPTTHLSQLTTLNPNGATEIIKLWLRESPTTTIIFTPTTIRGRRTSFSHILPTTAYTVEKLISTKPIDANAPLANILLSQLLLGNLGQLNAFSNFAVLPTIAPTKPATHYQTRSTTFVTTLTNELSTILPLTFHGKEILTTIYDRTLSTVTATEYITDTIVDQPSQAVPQQQALNSLLLPLLLQQNTQTDDGRHLQAIEDDIKPSTSIVTLYVSGRTPGDFSTLLSTTVIGNQQDQHRPKRTVSTEMLATVPPDVTTVPFLV